jgi:membrane protein DedA with SNARE-associated domain
LAYELRQNDELLLDFGFLMSYGYLGILLLVLAINLIPFASPSNLVLAGAVAYFTTINPIAVALIVAIAATLAKLVHYSIAALFGKRMNHSKGKLSKYSQMIGKWGVLGAFIAAATPIPDDPIVIPLGLMRYDFWKFAISYFLGKMTITLLGAYGARAAAINFETLFGNSTAIIASAIVSAVIVSILFKMDPSQIRMYMSKLRGKRNYGQDNPVQETSKA